ncbi:glycine-rich domain-containing protein [Aurantimonas coralicida]|uniref:glycine-rich domain-containing protein n=1 Tax=Aurantimonas coralicida TaxID=182270 RepID=UPI001D193595|nr:hypothetical protein [Aurantimonas coralicida]MCC4298436.1 hypothetical protein [Aurantimonas coralicida]
MAFYRPLPGAGGSSGPAYDDTEIRGRIEDLESQPSGGGAGRRHLLGIHAITSSGPLSKGAILARDWMEDIDPATCDVDIFLVGGGAGGKALMTSYPNASMFIDGGYAAGVTVVRNVLFEQLPDGAAIYVGAGGAGLSSGQNSGGDTSIAGLAVAFGGRGNLAPLYSDVPIGAPGLGTRITAEDSAGPGSGGGTRYSEQNNDPAADGKGGDSSFHRLDRRLTGGTAGSIGRQVNPAQSAPAESLRYGSGGCGSDYGLYSAGDGGFPGGGGGGKLTGNASYISGKGGNGVVRFAVYQWR